MFMNPEEDYCKKYFEETYNRRPDGRFIVELPIKKDTIKLLKNSREVAGKRFLVLERKFAKNLEFKNEYIKFMQEYIQLVHMRQVDKGQENKIRVFLPHHAVIKECSATTKIRVVFNASSQYALGKSLNEALKVQQYKRIYLH